MAPELFGAAPPSVATEVYALGVTFYNLLTGTVPFPARSMQELKDYALFSAAPDVAKVAPETPSKMAAIVAAMLDKDPLARPTVSLELLEELDELAIELIPTKEIVADAMADVEVKWEALDAERFRFKVTLPDDRSQTVEGETLEGEDGHKVMTFWTPCAPAAADHFRFVLELNGRLPFGAVSIRRMKDQDYFVMTSNHPRATLDPEEVRAAVLKMAQWADHIEHRLTGQDVH
jgi:serine/threonine-protein kinase